MTGWFWITTHTLVDSFTPTHGEMWSIGVGSAGRPKAGISFSREAGIVSSAVLCSLGVDILWGVT